MSRNDVQRMPERARRRTPKEELSFDFLRKEKAAVENIAAGKPLQAVLTQLTEMIEEEGSDLICSICLFDDGTKTLAPIAGPSLPQAFREALEGGIPIGPAVASCGTAAYRRQEVVSVDIATDPLWADFRSLAIDNGLRAAWSTPILSEDEGLLGTFAIFYRTARAPSRPERQWVASATHIAAVAITRHRTALRMEWLAHHDVLTGLLNRTRFDTLAHDAIGDGRPFGLAFVDLDNFKQINDSVGHRVGDEVLREIAKRLTPDDSDCTAARLGGDEFAVLLRGYDSPEGTHLTAERILANISRPTAVSGFEFVVTASIGVSLYPTDGKTVDGLVERADRAMYNTKLAGKNGVRLYEGVQDAEVWLNREPFVYITKPGANRLTDIDANHDAEELARTVGERLQTELACLRLVTSSGRLYTLGLWTRTPAFADALKEAIAGGTVGGVIPNRFDTPMSVTESRVRSVIELNPAAFPTDGWVEHAAIREGNRLSGIFSLAGDRFAVPLSIEERATLKHLGHLAIFSNDELRKRTRLEEQMKFITTVSTSLSSTEPIVERLKKTVVAAQKALDFDSIQIITWNPTHETLLLSALYVRDIGFISDETWDKMTREEVTESIERFKASPEPYIVPDPAELEDIRPDQRAWMRHNRIRYLIFVPLIHENEQYGTLVITSHFNRTETDERLATLTSIGGHLAALLQLSLLLAEVQQSYSRLRDNHLNIVETLAIAAEMKDRTTGRHLKHLRTLSQAIGRQLSMSEVEVEDLGFAAVVHDIGKLYVPDNILTKPTSLNLDEWRQVRMHTQAGEKIIAYSDLPAVSREVVRSHHERWDGSGYPDGLRGEAIPHSAQIVAIADVLDALVSKRPYKAPWPLEAALAEILKGKGKLFNPDVTDALLSMDLSGVFESPDEELAA